MLEVLKLTNFRQHRDLTVNFTAGLNVIRGANEAGKSTIMEAIAYVLYGARSLANSLEETVTWGEQDSTLRVELTFSFDGVPGWVRRGKSGASLKYGATTAEGQSEVTRFFERLFKVDAKMASNLQIASQNKVRGALEGGSAVALIESLADFSLLETLVDKITTHRPSGNTNLVLTRLNTLKAAQGAEIPPEPDAGPVEAVKGHLRTLEGSLEGSKGMEAAYAALVPAARERIAQARLRASQAEAARRRVELIQAELAKSLPAVTGNAEVIAGWREAAQKEANRLSLLKVYRTQEPKLEDVWGGTREAFLAELEGTKALHATLQADIQLARDRITQQRAMRINEKSCAFCKKSLEDVPEVASVNASVDAALETAQAELAALANRLGEATATLAALQAIQLADAKYPGLFPLSHWTHSEDRVPPRVTWIGEPPSTEADDTDYYGLIKQAEASAKELANAEGRRAALQAELLQVQATADQNVQSTIEDEATIADWEVRKQGVQNLTLEVNKCKGELALAEQAYQHALVLRKQAMDAAAAAAKEIAAVTQELEDMGFYNELVKKIRAARPAVANKLWALVMAAVSHYTTQGRGQPSVVTRDDGGFKINGKAATGGNYSGSAQDVLGLAIRLALVKTFLPGSPFMIMDEIAAACDDSRELDLLGMVLAADIPQVLLVTHSNAAESFATNLVQI